MQDGILWNLQGLLKNRELKNILLTKGNQLGIITVTVMITVKKENNKAI